MQNKTAGEKPAVFFIRIADKKSPTMPCAA
jgi:hypothetical protein